MKCMASCFIFAGAFNFLIVLSLPIVAIIGKNIRGSPTQDIPRNLMELTSLLGQFEGRVRINQL